MFGIALGMGTGVAHTEHRSEAQGQEEGVLRVCWGGAGLWLHLHR